MRLLIIDKEFPPNPHGGIGSYDLVLARTLGRYGYFVSVLTGTIERKISVREKDYGILAKVPYRSFQAGFGKYLRWIDAISFGRSVLPVARRLVSEYKLDLVEIPSASGYGSLLSIALKTEIPVITRFHGSLGKIPIDPHIYSLLEREIARIGESKIRRRAATFVNSPQWLLEREQILKSHRITSPSHFAKRWIKENIDCNDQKLWVIPNGIDPQEFSPYRTMRYQRKKERRLVCFVGRCSVPKGASVLARALPQILDNDARADILFAGPLFDARIFKQLNILSKQYPGRIMLPGRLPREQLLSTLAKAHCLVHPSFYEISPMAVLEAMALGLPVAASRTGPLPEIVIERETGLLFQPGDEDSLANTVLTLLSADHNQLAKMGNAATMRVDAIFNLNTLIQQQIDFYTDTLNVDLASLSK